MVENIITLLLLVLLQAVLGFDNLLYISIESKRAPLDKQKYVRTIGISIAIVLRIVLMFTLFLLLDKFKAPWFTINLSFIQGSFNLFSIVTLVGGVFILYTAIKEIMHMMSLDDSEGEDSKATASVGKTIVSIVIMNLVFSFDSILSALPLTDNKILISIAIVISGLLMIWLADKVSAFLQKNRMYEVLGLFVLFIVGILLLSEGGHKAELTILGNHVEAMSKTTFYFVIGVLIVVDLVQSRYQKKINKEK